MEAKKTILFVVDNPGDRRLVSFVLGKHEFHVLLGEDGPSGRRMVQENKVDLIILDILLPGISGIELCKEFKKNQATQSIPVIFYSAMETPKYLMEYASYGARDYIQKSMSPEDLISAIKVILDQ